MELEITSKKHGRFTVLYDAEDHEIITQHKWHVFKQYNTFYAMSHERTKEKTIGHYMHRLITKAQPGQIVDHINGNGLDNRKENLRFCTNQQNVWNSRKPNKQTSSQYKGVNWDRGRRKWRATIGSEILGRFDNEKSAAICYNKHAKERFGEFARLNVIETIMPEQTELYLKMSN